MQYPFGGFGNIFGGAFKSIFNGSNGFCPPQPQPNPSRGPVIEELSSPDNDDKESTKTNKENPKKRGRPRKKPILEDEAPVKKSKYMSSRKPQANSFAIQSISRVGDGYSVVRVGGNRSISGVGNGIVTHNSNNVVTYNGNNVVTFNGGDVSCVGGNGITYNSNNVVTYNGGDVSCVGSVVSYVGGNGASRITSTITGSNGYTYEEFKEADSSTRQATHRVSRGIRNKAHSVTRKLKSDGHVDTVETLHNLNQDEVPGFEEEWTENAEKHLPQWSSKVSGNRIDISVNKKPKQSKRRYKKK